MKTSKILRSLTVSLLAIITACGGMDETYKEFIGDAPIVYLQKYESDSIKVQAGRERVKITLPATKDPRIDYVLITWANGMYEQKVPVEYGAPTEVVLDQNLSEGMYDFVITNYTEDGLFSISSSVIGETYGETYESYLRNRNIQKIEFDFNTNDMTLYFPVLSDSIIQGTELKWISGGVDKQTYYPNTEDNLIFVEEFPVDEEYIGEFQYRTHVMPTADVLDVFYSQWQNCRFVVEKEKIAALYDPQNWTFVLSYPELSEGGGPYSMIDNNPNTYLTMRKPGKGTDGSGATIDPAAESYFIVDLQSEKTFDYIEWYHRGNNNSLGLRVWAIKLFGSNDGSGFTQIGDEINIPGEDDSSIMNATLEVPESTYRFVKVQFTRWSTTANTSIQVGEFKLGYTKTETGKGVGIVL